MAHVSINKALDPPSKDKLLGIFTTKTEQKVKRKGSGFVRRWFDCIAIGIGIGKILNIA